MLQNLYRQKGFPVLQNRVYDTYEEAVQCKTGDIEIVYDTLNGLIYNAAFQPDLVVYDQKYDNEQGNSPFFINHLEEVATIIETVIGKERLVEVGCGKGVFLEMLAKRGADIIGFDPTYEGENHKIIKRFFESGLINSANGLILRHVLEHVQNPVEFLVNLKNANRGKGLIYIEVPCFEWICLNKAWIDIFYEHVNYFRLTDFYRIFENVLCGGRIFGGQYLYIIADLSSISYLPPPLPSPKIEFPVDFLDTLYATENIDERLCVWGAGSKGVIFSLLKERAGAKIDIVIDINKKKQGKYLPVTGIEIKSPENGLNSIKPGSSIYVMNPNYLDEIKIMTNNLFNYITLD